MNAKFAVLRIGKTKFEKKNKEKKKTSNLSLYYSLNPKKKKGQSGIISSPKAAVKMVSIYGKLSYRVSSVTWN